MFMKWKNTTIQVFPPFNNVSNSNCKNMQEIETPKIIPNPANPPLPFFLFWSALNN